MATYVRGTGSDLAGIDGRIERADRMFGAADRPGSPSTSVITWYGYDAPGDVVPDAMSDDYATQATDNLNSFQDRLRASHDDARPTSHNTVLSHSHGGNLVG